MSRKLNTTIVHGGEVYAAGTDESDIRDADGITAAGVWDGDPDTSSTVSVSVTDSEEFEKAAKALSDANSEIQALRARVAELEEELAKAGENHESGPYDGLDLDQLKAEIDKRNEGRDDESKLSKRGGVETLAGLLVADDAAQA